MLGYFSRVSYTGVFKGYFRGILGVLMFTSIGSPVLALTASGFRVRLPPVLATSTAAAEAAAAAARRVAATEGPSMMPSLLRAIDDWPCGAKLFGAIQ